MFTDLIHWLDDHAGAVQAFGSLVLVGITAWYAFLTRSIANEARRSQRPYVFVDIVGDGPRSLEFIIGNAGDRAAHYIKPTLQTEDGSPFAQLGDLEVFKSGIQYLAPGRQYRYRLDSKGDNEFFDESKASTASFSVALGYSGEAERFTDSLTFSLSSLDGALISSFVDPMQRVADSLRDIKRELGRRKDPGFRTFFTQLCPYCGSSLPTSAKKCKHCLEWLPEAAEASDEDQEE